MLYFFNLLSQIIPLLLWLYKKSNAVTLDFQRCGFWDQSSTYFPPFPLQPSTLATGHDLLKQEVMEAVTPQMLDYVITTLDGMDGLAVRARTQTWGKARGGQEAEPQNRDHWHPSKGSEGSRPVLQTTKNQQAGIWQWWEAGRSFLHPRGWAPSRTMCFSSSRTFKRWRVGATEHICNKGSGRGESSNWNTLDPNRPDCKR